MYNTYNIAGFFLSIIFTCGRIVILQQSPVSSLKSPVSHLISHVFCRMSPVSLGVSTLGGAIGRVVRSDAGGHGQAIYLFPTQIVRN